MWMKTEFVYKYFIRNYKQSSFKIFKGYSDFLQN